MCNISVIKQMIVGTALAISAFLCYKRGVRAAYFAAKVNGAEIYIRAACYFNYFML